MNSSDRTAIENDESNGGTVLLNRPVVALLAAGAIGFAVGAVIWQYRRTHPQRFDAFDRAVEMARSGSVDTVRKLRRRLRDEGYSPAQIQGRAKTYLSELIDAARKSAGNSW